MALHFDTPNKLINHLFKIRYPLIQAPMLGVATPDMVAAVCNAGAMGSLPLGGLSPEKARMLINEVKLKTKEPFAVNLFAHDIGEIDPETLKITQDYLEPIYGRYNLPLDKTGLSGTKHYNYNDLTEEILDSQIVAVSYTFGKLDADAVALLKIAGKLLIGTATSIAEAVVLEQTGADSIVVQGFEAGGHRGTFLDENEIPKIGLFSLLPQIADKVSIPLIAAGGIFDYRTVMAAFLLGASGVQIGSLFLAADESDASESYKEAVINSTDVSTVLTKSFSGRWARGIANNFIGEYAKAGIPMLPYPYQNTLTAPLRNYAKTADLPEINSLWAGQSASAARRENSAEILRKLIQSLESHNVPGFTA